MAEREAAVVATAVERLEIANSSGCRATLSPVGASLMSLWVPDREGNLVDVVLGFDEPSEYLGNEWYLGCTVGRYAGRIAAGELMLEGVRYQLPLNEGNNHLHGGADGFHRQLWCPEECTASRVVFSYTSEAGAQGYPGKLDVRVGFRLDETNALRIEYQATTTAATVINLTNHSYFNLAGHDKGDICDHWLTIPADRYVELDGEGIPSGRLLPVDGTDFDFRQARQIGERIDGRCPQLDLAGGYDHCWVQGSGTSARQEAIVRCERTGIGMTVVTDQPGVQFYTGNQLPLKWRGKGEYGHRQGLCLETQHLPNSPNEPGFPATALRPGQVYQSSTEYQFRAD